MRFSRSRVANGDVEYVNVILFQKILEKLVLLNTNERAFPRSLLLNKAWRMRGLEDRVWDVQRDSVHHFCTALRYPANDVRKVWHYERHQSVRSFHERNSFVPTH